MRTPRTLAVLAVAALPGLALAQGPKQPSEAALVAPVSAAELHATIEKLVSFGTRHSLSETHSDTRGIGAARRWVKSRFEQISRDCGGCLTVETPSEVFTGERIPKPTEIMDVVAVLKGTSDPNRVIIISGHLDSMPSNVMDPKTDAPGANDDASGTAAVIEAARILSKRRYPATLVFAALSGEEQGLYGGKVLANYAVKQGWKVEAQLNNDIVGNTHGSSGAHDDTHVRVFSEGVRTIETAADAAVRQRNGGEVDSPSRNLARFIDRVAERDVKGLDVVMIYRTDRYRRGGDQIEGLAKGFPAVRFTEANENYDRQHQTVRVENGRHYGDVIEWVDFPYLAKVTRLNAATMAALAQAPAPPDKVDLAGAVSPDTTVSWTNVPGAAGYRVWRRRTTEPQWQIGQYVPASQTSLKMPGVIIDDWFFGVSSVGADGHESPVEFPAPAGSFFPPKPAKP
ncbi:MAG TPA: M20/M25/M40 family metallo-hydrolase [Caulobacteraceae bacterium]|nr:M20/M25/M40 family metallo-hydrolase [Caulobacteraceae bacterium]